MRRFLPSDPNSRCKKCPVEYWTQTLKGVGRLLNLAPRNREVKPARTICDVTSRDRHTAKHESRILRVGEPKTECSKIHKHALAPRKQAHAAYCFLEILWIPIFPGGEAISNIPEFFRFC